MIFKKKISARLEENVINLIDKYKKDLDSPLIADGPVQIALNMISDYSVVTAVAGVSAIYLAAVSLLGETSLSNAQMFAFCAPTLGLLGIAATIRDYKKNIYKNDKIGLKDKFENNINSLLGGVDEKHPAVKRFVMNKDELDDIGKQLIEASSKKSKNKEANEYSKKSKNKEANEYKEDKYISSEELLKKMKIKNKPRV